MEHQREAIRWLIARGGVGALLCEPGLGKSFIALHYAGICSDQLGPQLWVVVCPLSVVGVWYEEVAKHLPENLNIIIEDMTRYPGTITNKCQILNERFRKNNSSADLTLVLCNYDLFQSRHKAKNRKTQLQKDLVVTTLDNLKPNGLILDEAHMIKSASSIRSKTLRRLAKRIPKRLLLTGTVAPHDLRDIWAQWDFLAPGVFPTRYGDFCQQYVFWGGFEGRQVTGFRTKAIQDKMANLSFSAQKKDCLDLPPIIEQVIPIELSSTEKKVYKELEKQFLTQIDEQEVWISNALVKFLRLRQVTSGFIVPDNGTPHRIGSSKLAVAEQLLEDAARTNRKVVVFAHFIYDIKSILDVVEKFDVPNLWINYIAGEVPAQKRQMLRQAFRDHNGPAIIICQSRTSSLGINEFVASDYAIFYSLSERSDEMTQAIDRLHRKGQVHESVLVRHLMAEKTVDEVLYKVHKERLTLEQATKNYVYNCRRANVSA